jgi:hypothetical protein
MKKITQRDLIKEVAKRWREQYTPFKNAPDKLRICLALDALDGNTASAEDVAAIIGNASWANLTCDDCEEYVTEVMELGQEPDYESHTASICGPCLEKALKILRNDN